MELVQELSNVAQRVGDIVEERDALKQRVQQLELGLAEANGCIKTQDKQIDDLKDRLTDAVKDATYFREKVSVVTQSATRMADELVTLIKDVEHKPKPLLSLEDIEEKKPEAKMPGEAFATPPQIKLTSTELLNIAQVPEGQEFSMGPGAEASMRDLKNYYRHKLGKVPNRWREAPWLLLCRNGDKLNFIRFVYPNERRSVQPENQPLPPAPNIPPAQTGDFDGNGRLGGTDPIPPFLARGPANGGNRADITDTST